MTEIDTSAEAVERLAEDLCVLSYGKDGPAAECPWRVLGDNDAADDGAIDAWNRRASVAADPALRTEARGEHG